MVRLSTILFVGAIGCQDHTEPLADTQLAAPGAAGLDLSVTGVLENNTDLTFTVAGAQPGESVWIVLGDDEDAAPSVCPPQLRGLCFDITNPRPLGIPENPLTADASGMVSLTVTVPPDHVVPNGAITWFQAATLGASAATSNTTVKFNPEPSGPAELVLQGNFQRTNQGIVGTYAERIVASQTGLDICTIQYEATVNTTANLAPCQGCSFAFATNYEAPTEPQSAGDCAYFFNYDVSQLSPFMGSIGFHPNYYVYGVGYQASIMQYSPAQGAWLPVDVPFTYTANTLSWDENVGSLYY